MADMGTHRKKIENKRAAPSLSFRFLLFILFVCFFWPRNLETNRNRWVLPGTEAFWRRQLWPRRERKWNRNRIWRRHLNQSKMRKKKQLRIVRWVVAAEDLIHLIKQSIIFVVFSVIYQVCWVLHGIQMGLPGWSVFYCVFMGFHRVLFVSLRLNRI